jgi:6-phosphogluconolactonase
MRVIAKTSIGPLLLLTSLLLAACGGGGGSNTSTGGGSSDGTISAAAPTSNNSPDGSASTNDSNSRAIAGTFAYVLNGGPKISAYSLDETTGALSEIPGSPFAADNAADDMVVTPSGQFAYVGHNSASNQAIPTTKNIWIYAIDTSSGGLTHVGTPVEPAGYPQSIAMHPSGKAIFVAVRGDPPGVSAGDVHHISGYAIDAATGLLTSIGSTPINGWPSIITIDPAGRFAYVATEDPTPTASGSGFISVYAIDATNGSLSEIAGSPFATDGWVQKFGITPDGRFAYAAGHALVGYAIDATTGALSELPGSPFSTSQVVTVHPSGRFVYGQEPGSDPMAPDSVTYAINETTGALSKVGSNGSTVPFALALSPSGKFIYGTRFGLSVNAWDAGNGMLTHLEYASNASWLTAIAITNTYR